MDEPQKHAQGTKPATKDKHCMMPHTPGPERSQTPRDRKEKGGWRGWGRGLGSECWVGTEFHWGRWEVLQMEGGGGCTTAWMCLMPVNYTLKNGQEVNFTLCTLYHNRKGLDPHFLREEEVCDDSPPSCHRTGAPGQGHGLPPHLYPLRHSSTNTYSWGEPKYSNKLQQPAQPEG